MSDENKISFDLKVEEKAKALIEEAFDDLDSFEDIVANDQELEEIQKVSLTKSKLKALIGVVGEIDQKMQSFSKSVVKHKDFSDYCFKDVKRKFSKIYVKFYEPFE